MATNEIVVTQEEAAEIKRRVQEHPIMQMLFRAMKAADAEAFDRINRDMDEAPPERRMFPFLDMLDAEHASMERAAEQRGYESAREQAAGAAEAVKNGALFKLLEMDEPTDAQTGLQLLLSKVGAEIATTIRSMKDEGR